MAKIFRIHKGSINTLSNWDYSQKIGSTAIASILDPVGATDKKEITSIPSPFARMDLVKQAFKIVANSQLDGNTIYHKLVSDTLDVGQIFFNIEKYRDIIEILVWNKNFSLNELRNSIDEEHKRLGNTYKTYLEQDGDEYNFNQMDCIYLLNYIDSSAPKTMNIIGATSPATIFFTSANDLSYVGNKIIFGNDKPFDGDYKPLYKRNFDYIKYWWSLKCSRPDFPKLFPEVDLYLDKSFQQFTNEQKEQLRYEINAENNYYNNQYEEIPVSSTVQQYVMVLDQKLRRKPDVTSISSGFEMKISDDRKKSMNKVPLALPISKYSEPTYYVQSNWNMDTKVPYIDLRPIGERTLPGDGVTYPYVTIGDFLEDTILRIPHKFNKKSFFNGNDDNPDAPDSYLLPLKKTYFDYFDVEDLEKTISGKKIIEICRLSGKSVKVILRIPIKDNKYVQYERIYFNDSNADASLNKGGGDR